MTRDEDFSAQYHALFVPAVRLALRMVSDRQLAEDLAAEALARAYVAWERVVQLESPQAWVLRVTTNLAVDHVRRQATWRRSLRMLLPERPQPDVADEVTQRVALVAALGALPRRQREAMALYYLAGLSEDEVSRLLGITPSTVRSHVQRGLESMRAAMEVRKVSGIVES